MKSKIALSLLLLLAGSGAAWAHLPFVERHDFSSERPFVVPGKIEKSIAVYSSLNYEPRDRRDVYEFRLTEADLQPGIVLRESDLGSWQTGFIRKRLVSHQLADGTWARQLHFGNLLPACRAHEPVEMRILLIGPQQDALSMDEDLASLPADVRRMLSADEGYYFLKREEVGAIYFEEITRKNYFYPESVKLILNQPGRYRLVVWEGQDRPVDFVLELGDIESWGAPDILQALRWTPMILKHQEVHSEECRADLARQDSSP